MLTWPWRLAALERDVRTVAREVRDLLRDHAELAQELDRAFANRAAEVERRRALEDKYKALEADNADLSITCAELQLRVLALEHGRPNVVEVAV